MKIMSLDIRHDSANEKKQITDKRKSVEFHLDKKPPNPRWGDLIHFGL